MIEPPAGLGVGVRGCDLSTKVRVESVGDCPRCHASGLWSYTTAIRVQVRGRVRVAVRGYGPPRCRGVGRNMARARCLPGHPRTAEARHCPPSPSSTARSHYGPVCTPAPQRRRFWVSLWGACLIRLLSIPGSTCFLVVEVLPLASAEAGKPQVAVNQALNLPHTCAKNQGSGVGVRVRV